MALIFRDFIKLCFINILYIRIHQTSWLPYMQKTATWRILLLYRSIKVCIIATTWNVWYLETSLSHTKLRPHIKPCILPNIVHIIRASYPKYRLHYLYLLGSCYFIVLKFHDWCRVLLWRLLHFAILCQTFSSWRFPNL